MPTMMMCYCPISLWVCFSPLRVYVQHERCFCILALKKRHKGFGKGQVAEVIGRVFNLHLLKVHAFRFREVKPALDARVDEYAIQIFMALCNTA